MPLWSRGQKGVALMRFGGGDGAVRPVPAVRMWERTCGLELLGSVASILVVVDCLVLRSCLRRSGASCTLGRNGYCAPATFRHSACPAWRCSCRRYPGRRHRRRRGGVALGFHGVASWWVPGIPVLAVVFGMLTKQLYKFTMLHGCNTILSSILGSWVSAVLEGFVGLCRSPGIRW